MKHLSLLTLALATFLTGNAELVTYPAGPGVETLDDFTVEVRQGAETPWKPVAVYPVKVDEVRGTKHTLSLIHI